MGHIYLGEKKSREKPSSQWRYRRRASRFMKFYGLKFNASHTHPSMLYLQNYFGHSEENFQQTFVHFCFCQKMFPPSPCKKTGPIFLQRYISSKIHICYKIFLSSFGTFLVTNCFCDDLQKIHCKKLFTIENCKMDGQKSKINHM